MKEFLNQLDQNISELEKLIESSQPKTEPSKALNINLLYNTYRLEAYREIRQQYIDIHKSGYYKRLDDGRHIYVGKCDNCNGTGVEEKPDI